MRDILNGLRNQPGVQVALVFASGGRLVDFVGNPMYDEELLGEVIGCLNKALESLELVHDQWETIWVGFEDGTILLRSFTTPGAQASEMLLAVMTDSTANQSFVTVALRVAIQKLRKRPALPKAVNKESMPNESWGRTSPVAPFTIESELTRPVGLADFSVLHRPQLESGPSLSWSGGSQNGALVVMGDVAARDQLKAITVALARYVGPMAKVFVRETVRAICRDGLFSVDDGERLQHALAERIESPEDRSEFIAWKRRS
ncbi:MAG: hypothetical protein KTR25_07245 [Myxococcales bacterium]|nr:hypothetical protein [Myxococcales bacterium]